MEKAEEGNVPQTFRSRLRSCAGEERLIGVETRPTRVAVGLRLHVLHRQRPGHEPERIGELPEAPKSGEAAIDRSKRGSTPRVRRPPLNFEHVPPDTTAAIFWLKNPDPAGSRLNRACGLVVKT